MAKVNVLGEILDWSTDRPLWQRDALRRLVVQGELKEADITELVDLCKANHGLVETGVSAEPLDAKHLPSSDRTSKPVSLLSLTHHSGVNALAPEQSIEFGSHLTVVFGRNGAGKSGYTRILKRACRARGAEEILGNVVSDGAPGRPSATIRFCVDEEPQELVWDDDQPANGWLSRVSVFDRHCASVYIAEETDVAFRPMGLDLFDKLAGACDSIQRVLERERRAIALSAIRLPEVAAGTTTHQALSRLSSLTNPDAIRALAALSEAEQARIREIRLRLTDLRTENPQTRARLIELQASRAQEVAQHVREVAEALSRVTISAALDVRRRMTTAADAAENARAAAFGGQALPNTGSQAWRALWDAAARYSTADAYPAESFPATGPGSRCVLCQQKLREEGAETLRRFSEFLTSTLERERDEAFTEQQRLTERLSSLMIQVESIARAIDEIQIESRELAESTRAFLRAADNRRAALLSALSGTEIDELQEVPLVVPDLNDYLKDLRERVAELSRPDLSDAAQQLEGELREFEARQALASQLDVVLAEIERRKRVAAYQVCVEETRTNAVTLKSTDITKRAVTEQLIESFRHELGLIKFRDVEVEMVVAGGSRGALYHKLQLRRAPGVSVADVVSEGEARCLSIASFFAELSTTEDRSAILFDDPVSSLDHSWRESVATRLAVASRDRQVVVFTHDIVFLRSLVDQATLVKTELKQYTLWRGGSAAGLATPGPAFGVRSVKERIGYLNDEWQAVEKLYRDNKVVEYEHAATRIYAHLRQAWERGVEELLINGVVERFRHSVETQRARKLQDITEADCEAVEKGMTRCSKWEGGHDRPAADGEPIPDPAAIRVDIDAFDTWVKQLRKRRQ